MAYLSAGICDELTDEVLDTFRRCGYYTVNDLCGNLMDIKRATGLRFSLVKSIVEKVKERYRIISHDANFVLEKFMSECKMVPTGLPELSSALDGGFQTQEIIEFTGESESGKTEMCYLLCGEILAQYEDYKVLYVAANYDLNIEKLINYTKAKAGNRALSEDDLFKALSRVDIARPSRLTDLTHLLNTIVHSDRGRHVKCIIIDSISFIIQEDILEIKSANLDDADELEKFLALKGMNFLHQETGATVESTRKEILDIYLHEVMRLLINIATTKNVIVVMTNSDDSLTQRKAWVNAIDHRILLSKMPDYSRYKVDNPGATVCRATILKTIHNVSKIGHSIPFAINDEGLYAIRIASS